MLLALLRQSLILPLSSRTYDMHIKQSLQLKITIIFLFLGSISLLISFFSFQNLNHFLNEFNASVDSQNATNQSTQQVLLSLEEANAAVNGMLDIQDPTQSDKLQTNEAQFSKANTAVEMYTNVLIWGSKSEAFRKSEGGISYAEWQRLHL